MANPEDAGNSSCAWIATPRHTGGKSVPAQRERSIEIDLNHVRYGQVSEYEDLEEETANG
jgi:hypothetical protein